MARIILLKELFGFVLGATFSCSIKRRRKKKNNKKPTPTKKLTTTHTFKMSVFLPRNLMNSGSKVPGDISVYHWLRLNGVLIFNMSISVE